jgi:hypothetical protein
MFPTTESRRSPLASALLVLTPFVALVATVSNCVSQMPATPVSAPVIVEDVQHDLSQPLSEIAKHHPAHERPRFVEPELAPREAGENRPSAQPRIRPHSNPHPLLPRSPNPFSIVTSFEGINTSGLLANGLGVYNFATDSSGAVGPHHYFQVANFAFNIYDRAGNLQLGPLPTSALFSGFSAPCGLDWSDAVVLYDRSADRWFFSRFASDQTNTTGGHGGKWYQCFAISQTSNPIGAYYRYAFEISPGVFNDYPKFGIWPDAYYMTADEDKIFASMGVFVIAFEREKMLHGAAARMVQFTISNDGHRAGMLPADWEGDLPPAHAPNYLVRPTAVSLGWPADSLEVWEFKVDWHNASASSLTLTNTLTPPTYDSPCGTDQDCIPQPGTTEGLDSLAYGYLMYRLAYRNFADHQSMLLNYTVEEGDLLPKPHAAVRWFELRKEQHRPWTIYQHGDYAPDSSSRWIGSVAQDRYGNIAVGYDVSSSDRFPSIAFAGRLKREPIGTMSVETTIKAGGGSQTGYVLWGDYSQMTVDPTDDCTFWYVNTYQPSTSASQNWATHIAAFRSQECTREHHH